MAGVTSPLNFPYPTGTDRVADGDNAIQALAEAVDDHLSIHAATGTVTLAGTVTGSAAAYRRPGGTVILLCDFWAPAGGLAADGDLGTIAGAAYRPVVQLHGVLYNLNNGAAWLVRVGVSGLIETVNAMSANHRLIGQIILPGPG